MDKSLMRYIPKEYKNLVVNIYRGTAKEWDEIKKAWSYPLFVEWENGEISQFQNASFAKFVLKEFHGPDEYSK